MVLVLLTKRPYISIFVLVNAAILWRRVAEPSIIALLVQSNDP
jgi:hypothetical protein